MTTIETTPRLLLTDLQLQYQAREQHIADDLRRICADLAAAPPRLTPSMKVAWVKRAKVEKDAADAALLQAQQRAERAKNDLLNAEKGKCEHHRLVKLLLDVASSHPMARDMSRDAWAPFSGELGWQ